MILCAGAASQRVVEEAARLRVHQVVASRRQVGETVPGYTGYTSETLVEAVHRLSGGTTRVVRDHGGPYQNGDPGDNWTAALDADAGAGLDVLHLDVCYLPYDDQPAELIRLCRRYRDKAVIEVGGERDTQSRLDMLLETALTVCQPSAAVADFGGHIWADRQHGRLISQDRAEEVVAAYAVRQVAAKAHNFDWLGQRRSYGLNSLYNVAPEFGNVEIDAWLHVLFHADGQYLLKFAYGTGSWQRWFSKDEGTWLERARAALRYHLHTREVRHVLARYDDSYVREVIRDAIRRG